jgi:hypothetical protein
MLLNGRKQVFKGSINLPETGRSNRRIEKTCPPPAPTNGYRQLAARAGQQPLGRRKLRELAVSGHRSDRVPTGSVFDM